MSSTCPECEMRFTRRDNMKRHFNSRHENMKFIPPSKKNGYDCPPPPPPKETGYNYTPPPPKEIGYDYTPPPPPPKEIGYDYTPPPPPSPKETGYDYTPPPPLKETGYDYTPPPPRGPELSSLQHQTETEEPYFILKTNNPFFVLGSGLKRSRSFHAMGASVYQCDLGTYRQWKIRFCQEIRTQYQTHDDPNTRSHLVVLWRIPDFIRYRRWGGLSTRIVGLG